jgi:hypothetical protein
MTLDGAGRLGDRVVLMLGTQHDSVLEAAEAILAAGGRVVAGLVHNPYYGEINPDSVESIGRMLFEYLCPDPLV